MSNCVANSKSFWSCLYFLDSDDEDNKQNGFSRIFLLLIALVGFGLIVGLIFYFFNFSDLFPKDSLFINKARNTVEKSTIVMSPSPSPTDSSTNLYDKKFCVEDKDCGLLLCEGCFNKDWIKDWIIENGNPTLPCAQYDGYKCQCINNRCTEVK